MFDRVYAYAERFRLLTDLFVFALKAAFFLFVRGEYVCGTPRKAFEVHLCPAVFPQDLQRFLHVVAVGHDEYRGALARNAHLFHGREAAFPLEARAQVLALVGGDEPRRQIYVGGAFHVFYGHTEPHPRLDLRFEIL